MTLQPCPNEECRGECELELYTEDHDGTPGLYRAVCENPTCGYCGPVSYDPKQATYLHNRMPRTEPWVSVAERMPELGDTIEVWEYLAEGYWWAGKVVSVRINNGGWTQVQPIYEDGVGPRALETRLGHIWWRPHTPPRGPVSR